MRAFKTLCATMAVLCLAGCQEYQSRPLNPALIVTDVERARHLGGPAFVCSKSPAGTVALQKPELTFAYAAELLKQHSPDLKDAEAEYQTALGLANVKSPLPNPAIEAGPNFGFGPGVPVARRLQPFASIGFSIPTGKRLRRQDELNQTLADQARAEFMIKHRELYLKLRRLYTHSALAQSRVTYRKELSVSGQRSLDLTKKLVEIGNANGLDLGLMELETARIDLEILSAETDAAATLSELSELIGVHDDSFNGAPQSAGPLPENVPTLAELQQTLAMNHPQLARTRLAYEVAERQLRLEIARQYPDFQFGPQFARDTDSKKSDIGLTLGIALPIFDRNQQAIATACRKRDEIRTKYESAANRALSALDKAWRDYSYATKKLTLLKTVLLPRAQANIDQARKSLETGTIDSLRFLETERSQRTLSLDVIDTELALRRALNELEQAVGYPLFLYPTETAAAQPAAPALLLNDIPVTPTFTEVQK